MPAQMTETESHHSVDVAVAGHAAVTTQPFPLGLELVIDGLVLLVTVTSPPPESGAVPAGHWTEIMPVRSGAKKWEVIGLTITNPETFGRPVGPGGP
jgi:hypothetical protein